MSWQRGKRYNIRSQTSWKYMNSEYSSLVLMYIINIHQYITQKHFTVHFNIRHYSILHMNIHLLGWTNISLLALTYTRQVKAPVPVLLAQKHDILKNIFCSLYFGNVFWVTENEAFSKHPSSWRNLKTLFRCFLCG